MTRLHRRDGERGGLLSRDEICRLCDEKAMMSCWSPSQLRPAGYNVRIANDGLVTPKGDIYKPRSLGGKHTYDGVLWLAPGDEAELSSLERFTMPPDIAGNITIRTEFSGRGLLLLSGLLIDPGYGPSEEDGEQTSDGRLHFFVANLGTDPIPLTPKMDSIAAVQFFRVVGGGKEPDDARNASPTVARWDEERPTSRLGFIAQMQELKQQHAELGRQVERTKELTMTVLFLGYFLLAATILGLTLDSLLSVGSDPSLVEQVSRAVPDSVSGKVLIAAALLTAAWMVRSIVTFIYIGRTPPIPAGDRFFNLQARQDLVARRQRWRAGILLVAGLLAFGLSWLAVRFLNGDGWAWVLLGAALGCGALYADSKLVTPIDAHAVRQRTDELTELNKESVTSRPPQLSGRRTE